MIRSIQFFLFYLMLLLPAITFIHIWPLNSVMPDGGVLLLASFLFSLTLLRSAIIREIHFSALVILPIAMLVPLIISHLVSDVNLKTTLSWMAITLTVAALMVIVAEQLRSSEIDFQSVFAKGLLIFGVLYAIFALVQHYGVLAYLTGLPVPEGGRLKGAWQQPNLTTSTLWVAFFGAAFAARNNKSLIGILLFSLLIGAALALAASRLNILFIPLTLGVSCWICWSKKVCQSDQGRGLLAGSIVILASLFIVPPISAPLEQALAERGWIGEGRGVSLLDRESADRPRVMEHLKIANSLGGWSVKQLVFGMGAGQYGDFSYKQPVVPYGDASGQGSWLHSHNLFSMIFVEAGVLGLVVLLGVIFIVGRAAWKQRHTAWCVPALGGLGVIFIHSMVEYPLWYPWYLIVAILLAVPLFSTRKVRLTSPKLFSLAAVASIVVISTLTWNLGGQVKTILETAINEDDSEVTYRRVALLSNDGLLGPYAVLARYRRFSPEQTNIDWQLKEVSRISEWRPLDVVKLREVTLLLMAEEMDEACAKSRKAVLRFPAAGPIILEKAALIGKLSAPEKAALSRCVEDALEVWGENISSMDEKNLKAQ